MKTLEHHGKSIGAMLGENVIFLTLTLLGIGLFMVLNASTALQEEQGLPYVLASKQLTWILIGLSCFAFTHVFIPIPLLKKFSPLLALVCMIMLILVVVAGQEINGAKRWFSFGFIKLQPSEPAKLCFILYFAHLLQERQNDLNHLWRGPVFFTLLILLVCGAIAIEPDFGNAALIFGVLYTMLFISGARIKHLLICLAAILPAGLVLMFLKFDHIERRILAFLHPEEHLMDSGYQAYQALIALGSGGLIGKGLGQGLQKMYYLPEAHNDFIFAIIGEDLGLAGCGLVLMLYIFITWYIIQICRRAIDLFSLLVTTGIAVLFTGQALFNLFVVTSLLPNKGIPLPLISYGGSNILFTLIALAILTKIALHLPPDRPLELGAIRLRVRRDPLF